MPKKVTDIDRIMNYVETAPISALEVVLTLANARYKVRRKEVGEPSKPATTAKKTVRPAKVNGAPVIPTVNPNAATAFNYPTEEETNHATLA